MAKQDREQHRSAYKHKEPQITAEDLTEKVNGHLNTLIDAINTGDTERLTSYLAFSSRFHTYSRRNQQLIFSQCPQATRVASYPRWKAEGYQVRYMDKAKGEHGIRILVPKFPKGYKRLVEAERSQDEEPDEQKARAREVFFVTHNFNVGTVFDVSHLTPDRRPPEFFLAMAGDHQALHNRLIAAVEKEGIVYKESVDTEGARGYSAGKLIVVRPDQPPGNKAAVTAHEWAHEILHKDSERANLPKQVKEAHAEAAAFVVLSHFDVTIPYSVDYLRMWGNTPETIRKELDQVSYAASYMIARLHTPGEQHFHDQAETTET